MTDDLAPARRTVAKGALAGMAALLLGTGASAGAAAPTAGAATPTARSATPTARSAAPTARAATPTVRPALRLPTPTGPYPVGATVRHLVDSSRVDPWTPAIGVRELMVTVLAPAVPGGGELRHAREAPAGASRACRSSPPPPPVSSPPSAR